MLLQAFDYWWLHKFRGCNLQIGGSDQWGNITAGVDLIRRREGAHTQALTWPLITRSDGQKFGKSVSGAIWLDPQLTLPYEFHQYWLRVDDRDVGRFLLQLTLRDPGEIAGILEAHASAPDERGAQRELADSLTELVHGAAAVRQSNLAAEALFGGGDLNGEILEALRGIVPETVVTRESLGGDDALISLLCRTELTSSKGEARRLLAQGGVALNREKVSGHALADGCLIDDRFLLLQKGRKQRHLVVVDTAAQLADST